MSHDASPRTTEEERALFAKAEPILDAALELTATGDRVAFVESACSGDEALRRYVDRLLRFGERGEGLFDRAADALVEEARLDRTEQEQPLVGSMLGRYRLDRVLGVGGMGRVYYGVPSGGGGVPVAVKVLHAHLAVQPAWVRRFNEEREILARLTHEDIAPLVDGGVSGERPWIATAFVDGVSIDRFAAAARLPVELRVSLVRRVCAAVEYAHSMGVIHRDLTPANILVTAGGHPRLLDFGIAKLLDGTSAGRSSVSRRALTPGYASPEQLANEPPHAASDQYQLGLVLYELLAGSRPFAPVEKSVLRWSRAVLAGDIEPPSQRAASIGAAQCQLWGRSAGEALRADVAPWDDPILWALAKSPAGRFPTVGALAAALGTRT